MVLKLKTLWRDESGQDMIEYALLCASMVILVARFLLPSIMPSVSTIFSKVTGSFAIS
jgi:Flp pilus assembly pilin Flp